MTQSFPEAASCKADEETEQQIEWLKAVITALRNIRGEASIKPSQGIDVVLQDGDQSDRIQATPRKCLNVWPMSLQSSG